MATYTEHYGLHQWEPTDDFLRTDFNTDFGKIDAAIHGKADGAEMQTALAKKAEIVNGSYTGDGTRDRDIDLGFKPRMVLIPADEYYSFMAMEGFYNALLSITETGFRVSYISVYNFTPNESEKTYPYIALR